MSDDIELPTPPTPFPRRLDLFTKHTKLTLPAIAALSGINYHILSNANKGKISLDEAHLRHLAHTVPGLKTHGTFTQTRLHHPPRYELTTTAKPKNTDIIFIPGEAVQTGDYLRYESPKGIHSWIQVENIQPREGNTQVIPATAAGVRVILTANRPLWVARPINTEDPETPTTSDTDE